MLFSRTGGSADVEEGKSHPMVTDYQDYYQSNIVPFVATCAAIPNDEVKNIVRCLYFLVFVY